MCKINNCDQKTLAKELCSTHYMRLYRRKTGGTCDECPRNVYAKGKCESHYKSMLRSINKDYDTAQKSTDFYNKRSLSPEYKRVHMALKKKFGAARDYNCVDCGGPGNEWSLEPNSTPIAYGMPLRSTFPYSTDLNNYRPRCYRCHGAIDRQF